MQLAEDSKHIADPFVSNMMVMLSFTPLICL